MKKSLLFLMLLSLQICIAQTKPKAENYPLKAMDLVVFVFGMDYPITIGTISDSGELNFKLPNNINSIPEVAIENSMSDAAFTLFPKCNNNYDILTETENIKAVNAGYISLSSKENLYSGLLFMVTDENLVPWLEESYSNNAVKASYFELVYVENDFNYQGECTATVTNTENDTIETIYNYNLQLNGGFNFIEYKIESVVEHEIPSMYEENVFIKIAKPSKITVTSSQSTPPDTKWIGKYF
ncbi:hypothetical protein [Yeosuana marina]|uniref:hypothetical protein n=1 Tax=Yeosuana marina TaxID=1565536 RepID=UPI00142472C4|nr:hypothetical protein [Yeosuana marina]